MKFYCLFFLVSSSCALDLNDIVDLLTKLTDKNVNVPGGKSWNRNLLSNVNQRQVALTQAQDFLNTIQKSMSNAESQRKSDVEQLTKVQNDLVACQAQIKSERNDLIIEVQQLQKDVQQSKKELAEREDLFKKNVNELQGKHQKEVQEIEIVLKKERDDYEQTRNELEKSRKALAQELDKVEALRKQGKELSQEQQNQINQLRKDLSEKENNYIKERTQYEDTIKTSQNKITSLSQEKEGQTEDYKALTAKFNKLQQEYEEFKKAMKLAIDQATIDLKTQGKALL